MLSDQMVATAFNALAHPRRVRLFLLLLDRPELGRSVTFLENATGFRKAPLLHHLRILERAGLVSRKRTGSTVTQIVRPGPLTAAMADLQGRIGVAQSGPRKAA